MPIFDYVCTFCSSGFEKLVMNTDEHFIVCPECGCRRVKKTVAQPGCTVIELKHEFETERPEALKRAN